MIDDNVYAFMFNDDIHEGSMSIISLHRTKKGAYVAMRNFLLTSYMEWYNERIMYGKNDGIDYIDKFGRYSVWNIRTIPLTD